MLDLSSSLEEFGVDPYATPIDKFFTMCEPQRLFALALDAQDEDGTAEYLEDLQSFDSGWE